MAATVHSDPYAIFMRKIGYSVGLEYTAERMGNLVSRYLHDRDITTTSWNELVTGIKDQGYWGRDKSAEKNIGDFFQSLRLIQRTAGDVLVLENLDALAIVIELLDDDEKKVIAQNFILLWAILVNDGEIFINLLLANFDEKLTKKLLTAMMLRKRKKALELFKGKVSPQKINRVITIERQEKNKGSAGSGQSIASLVRTEPLQAERGSKLLTEVTNEIVFSEDYFRKVPPRRRDWATSLGLWDEVRGLTQCGQNFLDTLRQSGYIDTQNCFTYWPMDYELVRSGFRQDLFGYKAKSLWACLADFGRAYASLQVQSPSVSDADIVFEHVCRMMKVFRSLHVRKIMLRRELPTTIAYPAIFALHCAQGQSIIDFPNAIEQEQLGDRRRLALRLSRYTGSALSVKK